MTDDFKHAKITGQDMRDHWGPIIDRIADEVEASRDPRIKELEAENERLRATGAFLLARLDDLEWRSGCGWR